MMLASSATSSDTCQWLIDSGASNHYTSRLEDLIDFTPIKPIGIMTGKGYIAARGIGHVRVLLKAGLVLITHVMWVPELKGFANLLSVPQLTENGFKIAIERDVCEISYRLSVYATGHIDNRAFYLDVLSSTENLAKPPLNDLPLLGL